MAGRQGHNFKGERDPTSGRAKGTKNHRQVMLEELMEVEGFKQKLEDGTFVTPAVFWATILNDPTQSIDLKHEVAKAMAPYWYRKQPQVTETVISSTDNTTGFTISLVPDANNG